MGKLTQTRIERDFPIFKVQDTLLAFLNELISKDKKCSYHDSNKVCYILNVLDNNEDQEHILLASESYNNFNFIDCSGVIECNNSLIFYEGKFLEKYFSKSDRTKSISYYKRPPAYIPMIDDSKSYWHIRIASGSIALIEEV